MAKYKMVIMSTPKAGREDEFNDWYQNVHLKEMVSLPGFTSARRYRLAKNMREGEVFEYVAEYAIDTDDLDATLNGLVEAASGGALDMSDSFDRTASYAAIYEEFGGPVSE